MKKNILLTLVIISGALMFISLFNFTSPIELPENIEENFFVLGVAVDKGDKDESSVKLTIISEKFGETSSDSSSSGSSSKQADIVSTEGSTIFETIRNFNKFHSQKLFWGHIKYIIINEDLAKEDILNYLDFFIRDHELRFDTAVIIAKDTPANEILKLGEKNKEFIPDTLDSIFKNTQKIGVSDRISLIDVMKSFENNYTDEFIPSISIDETYGEENSNIVLDGYGVFKDKKLIGYITDGTSRGLNWINNKVQSTAIVVDDQDGNKVSLEIINSSCEKKIKFNGEIPEVTLNLKFSTNVSELMSQTSVFSEEDIKLLEEKQNKYVEEEINKIINYSKANDVDILHISDDIYHQYPIKWEKISDKWKDVLEQIDIKVNINSKINRTYHIKNPIGSDSES